VKEKQGGELSLECMGKDAVETHLNVLDQREHVENASSLKRGVG